MSVNTVEKVARFNLFIYEKTAAMLPQENFLGFLPAFLEFYHCCLFFSVDATS